MPTPGLIYLAVCVLKPSKSFKIQYLSSSAGLLSQFLSCHCKSEKPQLVQTFHPSAPAISVARNKFRRTPAERRNKTDKEVRPSAASESELTAVRRKRADQTEQ